MKGEDAEERHSSVSTSGRAIEICLIVVVLLTTAAFTLQRTFDEDSAEEIPSVPTIAAVIESREPMVSTSVAALESPTEAEAPGNSVPAITGEPARFVVQSAPYLFEPQVFDLDVDQELSFTVSGLPKWAVFEPSNGSLMGVPQEEDVGLYDGVVITVSDGTDTASLGPFSIEVLPGAGGTALIEWTPPSETVDGSPFPGITGYRIEYGQSPSALLQTINIDNPGVASYLVDNLAPGPWYFRVIAYDVEGLETEPTPIVEKIVQ